MGVLICKLTFSCGLENLKSWILPLLHLYHHNIFPTKTFCHKQLLSYAHNLQEDKLWRFKFQFLMANGEDSLYYVWSINVFRELVMCCVLIGIETLDSVFVFSKHTFVTVTKVKGNTYKSFPLVSLGANRCKREHALLNLNSRLTMND